MRILMVAPQPFFRPRGTPFSILHRIRALSQLGHTVELVTYPFGEDVDIPGLTIRRAPRPPAVRDVAIGPSAAKLLLDLPLFLTALRAARESDFELLHTHEEAGMLGALLSRKFGIPHLYDMHSSLPQQFANFGRYNWHPIVGLFRWAEKYTLARADGVIAICPELESHVLASGYRGPLALIENTLDFDLPGPDTDLTQSIKRQLGMDDNRIVLYTGTFESYQGIELLIAAADRVVSTFPAVRFVLVGGTPRQIASFEKLARQRQVDGAMVFLPAVAPEDVSAYQHMADVLVTTRSKGTNTPLKIYQYLRAGKPIVATSIRSHTQVLTTECAELVEPTPQAIAAGLVRVLSDAGHGRQLAEQAARLARERYSKATYMARLRDILEMLPTESAHRSRP